MKHIRLLKQSLSGLEALSSILTIVVFLGLFLIVIQGSGFAQEKNEGDLVDYSKIKTLRWVGPGRPGTFKQYLKAHPPAPRKYMLLRPLPPEPPPAELPRAKVLVVVNDAIYTGIQVNLDRYITDIQTQGYTVEMVLWSSGTAEDLKVVIQAHSTNLVGCVFVGELPCAWYEIENDFGDRGYRSFPCDLFLMDIDGQWLDNRSDAPMQAGVYDDHQAGTGDQGPEIFLARIDASQITGDSEVNLLNQYFDKVHSFYNGGITHTNFALTYTEDDWAGSPIFWTSITGAYPDNEAIVAPSTDRDDYRDNRLNSPTYEFIQLACHSGSSHHSFTRGGILNPGDIKSIPPQALFYNLFCCSSLRFTDSNYLGGAYLFNPSTTSLATIGSTKSGSMLVFDEFYPRLGDGKPLGTAFKEWFDRLAPYSFNEICWHYGMTMTGDPLLTPQSRTNLDLVQVLDRSGSMGGIASLGAPDTKIEILRIAADQFIQMMKPDIGNQLGLVQFNQNFVPFAPAFDADLSQLTTTRAGILQTTTVPSIVHGGSTSIGDGLTEAFNQLTGPASVPGNDKVILLVSDGKENTALWISDIQGELISNNIIVYPLGLGYGSGIDETKLTDLAGATGGTFRITSDELIFRKFFLEILAGAVDWSVLTDPIGELGRDERTRHPVTVNGDQTCVTFTTYWEGIDNAIDFEIIPPSGEENIITPQIAANNSRIRYGEHPRYAFYQIDFPIGGNLAGERVGVWTMKCTGTNQITVNQKVRFSMSAFAKGGAELEVEFDKFYHLTGDRVLVKSRLSRKGKPVTGATLDVYCNVPTVGAGNILHEGKVSLDLLKKSSNTSGDIISPVDRKLQILAEQAGKDILERGSDSFKLYDDGSHGDGKANDGIYANSFTATRIPGSYTFRFVASFTPSGSNLNITREWTKSFYNEVNIDVQYSVVDVRLSNLATSDDILFCHYDVKVAPRDKFGNYLGPGRPVTLTVVYPNGSKQPHKLDDNIDGTYTKEIRISQADVKVGAQMVFDVNGNTFAVVEKLPSHLKWSISFLSGATFPAGSFDNFYNSSYMFGFNFDYHISPRISLVGYLGYNRFNSALPAISDTHWWNISANLKYEFNTNPLRPYVNGGTGIYIPKNGNIKAGVNVGLGWDFSINANWIVELGCDYHRIFTGGTGTGFFTAHNGLIFRF